MTLLITLFGALIAAFGVAGIMSPDHIRRLLTSMPTHGRFITAVLVRLVFGALFLWLADDLRYPLVMRILGGLSIAAAFGILLMGRERLDRLVDWWMALNDTVLRLGMVFAFFFGAFLVHASL